MKILKHYHLLLLGFFLLNAMIFTSCKKQETDEVAIGKVMKGSIYLDLYEEGTVEAINSITVAAPNISWRYGALKITNILKDGTEVKKGDTLVVFDPSEVRKGVIESEARLQMAEAELVKMKAQHQSDLDDLEADYEVSSLAQEISKIRFESAVYEANIRKQEIQLNLEKANIALERAREQIENRKRIQREELKQKQISMNQDRAHLADANETLKKLYLISPSPGIAILGSNWSTGNKMAVGDQCWPGYPLVELPDLTALRANVKINEVDVSKISKGQKVEIRPDAFSGKKFTGEVVSVANLAVQKDNKSKIKVFPVEINIKETDKNLLPGLTVSCRIILGEIKDVLYVPLDAVFTEGDKSYVFKKAGKSFEKILVETGENNSDFIVIKKGLNVNDRVALSDPFKKKEEKKEESETAATPEPSNAPQE